MLKKNKILFVLDMDGTITENNIWVDLHSYFGTLEEAKKNFELFKNGVISYKEWLERDVRLWNYPNIDEIRNVAEKYVVKEGFEDFIETFRDIGYFSIVSAGLDVRAEKIREEYRIDESYSNRLKTKNKRIIGGEVVVTPYNKGDFVKKLKERGFDFVISIGDSRLDYYMFKESDMSFSLEEELDGVFRVRDFNEIIEELKKKLNSRKM